MNKQWPVRFCGDCERNLGHPNLMLLYLALHHSLKRNAEYASVKRAWLDTSTVFSPIYARVCSNNQREYAELS